MDAQTDERANMNQIAYAIGASIPYIILGITFYLNRKYNRFVGTVFFFGTFAIIFTIGFLTNFGRG